MIPTHAFSDKTHKRIIIHQLGDLMEYDSSSPHRHDYFELFVFGKGGGIHTIDFEPFTIHDCSIHIVTPGRVHHVRREFESNGFVVLFEAETMLNNTLITDFLFDHACYNVLEYSPSYVFETDQQAQIMDVVNRIWKDYNTEHPLKQEFILHNLALLFISCLRTQPDFVPVQSSANGKIYQEFRRMLQRRFRELKKVKEYASELNVSEKQLNEIVKAQTGTSASSIIYKQIIMEARRLLNTGLSAKEAAFDLQFDDPAHFSKFFKNQTGLSPSEFQKAH
jgi:AraC family transcriptional regulator, transcriptional activator of pobA